MGLGNGTLSLMSDWRLTPQNSALVVIDVQEKLMNVMPRRAELVASIQKLIGAARILKLLKE